MKPTRINFIKYSSNPKWLKRIRRTDPIEFNIYFNEWKRSKFGRL